MFWEDGQLQFYISWNVLLLLFQCWYFRVISEESMVLFWLWLMTKCAITLNRNQVLHSFILQIKAQQLDIIVWWKSYSILFYSFQVQMYLSSLMKTICLIWAILQFEENLLALLVLVRSKWDSREFFEIGNIWTEYHLAFSYLYRCTFCNSISHSSNPSSSVSQASINYPAAATYLTREVE